MSRPAVSSRRPHARATQPRLVCIHLNMHRWNQFEQKPGEYETKWTDIVAANRQELVVVTSPVKSTTSSIAALGEVRGVGGMGRGGVFEVGE